MAVTRTRPEKLVMVNWKHIQTLDIEFDRLLTLMEGDNGVGKSATLVASYVCHMPDQRQFHGFKNSQGEKVGTAELLGRLPDKGSAWVGLQAINGAKERLLYCVLLTKKGTSKLDIACLTAHGLKGTENLLDIFLDPGDVVRSASEVKEYLTVAGYSCELHDKIASYLAVLTNFGVHSGDLSNEGRRGDYADVILSCMYGGISQDIGSRLRDYLLPVHDAAARRINEFGSALKECRRTRSYLQELEAAHLLVVEFTCAADRMLELAAAGTQRAMKIDAWGSEAGAIIKNRKKNAAKKQLAAVTARFADLMNLRDQQVKGAEAAEQAVNEAREKLRLTEAAEELGRKLVQAEESCSVKEGLSTSADQRERVARLALASAIKEKDDSITALLKTSKALADAGAGLRSVLDRKSRHEEAVRLQGSLAQFTAVPDSATALAAYGVTALQQIEVKLGKARSLGREIQEADAVNAAHSRAAEIFALAFRRNWRKSAKPVPTDTTRPAAALAVIEKALLQRQNSAQRYARYNSDIAALEADLAERGHIINELANLGLDRPGSSTLYAWLDNQQLMIDDLAARLQQARLDKQSLEHTGAGLKQDRERIGANLAKFHRWQEERSRLQAAAGSKGQLNLDGETGVEDAIALLSSQNELGRGAIASLKNEAQTLNKRLKELQSSGVAPWISEACAGIPGARLVADLLDDVPVADSARYEAALGPLANGIVVDLPREVAAELAVDRLAGTLWLADRQTISALVEAPASTPGVVITSSGAIVRVTPYPESPVIGRLARESELHKVYGRRNEIDLEVSDLEQAIKGTAQLISDLDALKNHPFAFNGTLQGELEEINLALEDCSAQLRSKSDSLDALQTHQNSAQNILKQVNPLRSKAALLDKTELDATLTTLQVKRSIAARHSVWHSKVAPRFAELVDNTIRDLLRSTPRSEVELEQAGRELSEINDGIDTLQKCERFARELMPLLGSLHDSDSLQAAASAEENLKALRLANEEAGRRNEAAVEAHEPLVHPAQDALKAKNDAASALAIAIASREELRERHDANPESPATLDDVRQARSKLSGATAEKKKADDTQIATNSLVVLAEREVGATSSKLAAASAEASAAANELRKFFKDHYEPLQKAFQSHGKGSLWISSRNTTFEGSPDPDVLFPEASRVAGEVAVKIGMSDSPTLAADLLQSLQVLNQHPLARSKGRLWIDSYLMILQWLTSFYPEGILDSANPVEAMERMNNLIPKISARLTSDETGFRNSAQSIVSDIRKSMRNERDRISKMSHRLERMAFGSISGVTIQVSNNSKLALFLDAIENQMNLFMNYEDLPIEEILEDVYLKISTSKLDYHQLLDYRNYLELNVKIRRTSSTAWVDINASTGESIAVGTAVFITIFSSWEEESLLRRKNWSPMRFLLIDEASRLSEDTLSSIMQLAEELQVNILAACPEAPETGNTVAYHMEKHKMESGEEVVVITPRRTRVALDD